MEAQSFANIGGLERELMMSKFLIESNKKIEILDYAYFKEFSGEKFCHEITAPDGLIISLSLKISSQSPERLQTILDFSHTSNSGYVLQVTVSKDIAVLDWVCNGKSSTSYIPVDEWIDMAFGVDPTECISWSKIGYSPKKQIFFESPPSILEESIKFGIGYWLGGQNRDFIGEIKKLTLTNAESMSNEKTSNDFTLNKAVIPIVDISSQKEGQINKYNVVKEDGDTGWLSKIEYKLGQIYWYHNEFLYRDQDVRSLLEKFLSHVEKEDVIGSAHFLNEIYLMDLDVKLIHFGAHSFEIHIHRNNKRFNINNFSNDLLRLNLDSYLDNYLILSLLVSCAQTINRVLGSDASDAFFKRYKVVAKQPASILRDVELAQARLVDEGEKSHVLIKNVAVGGLEYKEYFKDKYCHHPFHDFEIRADGAVFVCCPSYLPVPIGNIFDVKTPEQLGQSLELKKIKESIKTQDFRYCSWVKCGKIRNGLEAVPERWEEKFNPVEFRLSYDPTCNLWCPSCRTEKIVATGSQRDKFLDLTEKIVLPLLKNAEICMMNGYGDIFASKACRKILKEVSIQEYPSLRFNFITNGVLLTRKEWDKFPNIHGMVDSIRVSMDAAKETTYSKLRLGGDWSVLQQNLHFISDLRKKEIIKNFMISMVIQEDNFREMVDFAKTAMILGCDTVIFEPIMNWNVLSPKSFKEKAVHYSDHPMYSEFKAELSKMYEFVASSKNKSINLMNTTASVNF
jgi:hypothetical protein